MILNSQPIVIFLGKSGAGKDTQMELLREKMGFDFINSGELLRERKKIQDFTGKKISQVIDNGGLILTPVIFKLWMDIFESIKNRGEFKGIIMDGSPRKIKEAYLLEEALEWYEWNNNIKVILIDISDEEAIERIGKRRYCEKCKEIYIYDGKMETCSKCGEKLVKRLDDEPEGIKKRLAWFKEEVDPVIDYYKERGSLKVINGEQEIDKVFEDILKAL
ncbi:MAG TPA: nucleoside monophosphate kinase [Candidatus Pacearchaeota archaeon]|nr:nucleoside monophosphate kinase [Candidatus Pacearchaeota archaeon]HOC53619.1 nucleoside monophosphate kinase [Candidatus Pacearchaeota archaeon]HQM24679.1 nucleoside monophosphate kinase [Candidatus Pacearchaeota archaeon]